MSSCSALSTSIPPNQQHKRVRRREVAGFWSVRYGMIAERLGGDFAVTNRHVIEEMDGPIVRVNRHDGKIDITETNKNRWRNHPDGDDISALRFDALSEEHQFLAINESAFLNHKVIAEYNVGIGDNVAMIGRLVGHDGKLRNSPTARFGSISMMPGEKIPNLFKCDQESFLVECHSIPGFSGSPVLLVLPSNSRSIGGLLLPGLGPWLMGIDWMHVHNEEPLRTADGKTFQDKSFVQSNNGIAGVIPAWKIGELLNTLKKPSAL